ncbi:MAG: archease [Candidatus Aenigmatarchaeota archaeon]
MKRFEFVDITTGDVAFIAYGSTLEELFSNAALAMFEIMVDTSKVEKIEKRYLECHGYDLESLLVNWLNDLLIFVDSENMVFSDFEVDIDENNFKLKAVCYGEKINKTKHETRTAVKAATYHKIKIEKNSVWKAQVIVDI